MAVDAQQGQKDSEISDENSFNTLSTTQQDQDLQQKETPQHIKR